MPFYVAYADSSGALIQDSAIFLSISPTDCDYPKESLATLHETTDGQVIKQQPNKDNRRRAWQWVGYRDSVPGWTDQWRLLEGLLSRTLIEGGAATPYCYVRDTVSTQMRVRTSVSGTASGGSSSTLTSVQTWTSNEFVGFNIHTLGGTGAGQNRKITSNDATSVTVTPNWTTTPDATTKFEIYGYKNDWLRVRVMDASQELRKGGGQVQYEVSNFVFVIDDPAYNDFK